MKTENVMELVLAVGLVSLILLGVWRLLQQSRRLAGFVLALVEARSYAQVARAELAGIDREYEALVAEHH